MISGIYKIINLITNQFYIGSASILKNRKVIHFRTLKENKHHNIKLQRSFNKHGKENFIFEVIEIVEDKSQLIQREQYYIDLLKPEYNICKIAGSTFGIKLSIEAKIKISVSNKGRVVSIETRNKISKNNKRVRAMLNKSHNEATKLKIGKASIDRKSAEKVHICNLKPVVQLDINEKFIKIWDSIKEVKNILGLQVSPVCLNKRKTAGGFKWKFKHLYK